MTFEFLIEFCDPSVTKRLLTARYSRIHVPFFVMRTASFVEQLSELYVRGNVSSLMVTMAYKFDDGAAPSSIKLSDSGYGPIAAVLSHLGIVTLFLRILHEVGTPCIAWSFRECLLSVRFAAHSK